MPELFGIDIAGIVADAIAPGLLDVTITLERTAARVPGKLTAGPVQLEPEIVIGAKGIWQDFTGQPPPGVVVELGDRKAFLIGDTIPAGKLPVRNTAITIEGQTLFVAKLLSRDPAAATYVYHCKARKTSAEG